MLQVLTMAAPSVRRSCSTTAWMPRNGPRQFTRQLFSKPSGVSSTIAARCRIPALFTSVVSAPNRSTVSATAADHCCGEVTSIRIGITASVSLDTGAQFVGPHVAGGHPESVGVQPRHDRRALAACRARDEGHPVHR